MSRQKGDAKCGICTSEVKDTEEGVACDGCKRWFRNSCGEISEDLYKMLVKLEGKKGQGLHWFCPTCNTSIKKVLYQMQIMLDKQRELEKEVANVRKLMDDKAGKEDMEELKKTVDEMKKDVDKTKREETMMKKHLQENKELIDNEIRKNERDKKGVE